MTAHQDAILGLMDAGVASVPTADATARLLALLRSVEWVNTADGETLYCPRCGQSEDEGHAPGCPLGAALRADGEAR